LRGNPVGSSVYQTEIANFSLVTASGTAGAGPSFFTVQGKDGLTYEYGNTTDSKILPPGATTPYIWALDKVTDRAGNQMTFTYFQQGGAYVPFSIQYTAPSGSTSFPYQVKFVYSTKSANDTLTSYVAGSQVQKTQQLSTITMTSSGTTVREYKLSYTTSSDTLRATLTSIQECGGSAGTDCLIPTTMGYQSGTAGFASPATASGSGATNGTVYSVDVDGDGRQDLVFATTSGTNYQWWVQLATATGYSAPISTGAVTVGTTDFLLDNFDGKGGTEILAPVSGVWYAYKYNGSTFTASSTGIAVVPNVQYSSADVDGDGLPDLIYLTYQVIQPGTTTLTIRLNTSASAISFNPTPVTQPITGTGCCTGIVQLYGNNQLQNSPVKHFDFDGDGRQDLILYYHTSIGGSHFNVAPILSRGTAAPKTATLVQDFSVTISPGFLAVLNWNDDACTDIALKGGVTVSPCNGGAETGVTLPNVTLGLALDWDGDGRTDLLANVGGIWQLYRSEGNAVAPAVSTGIAVGSGSYVVTDQNGDGLDDLVFSNSAAGKAIYYGVHNGAGIKPDLATSFVDGYLNSANPTYAPLTQSGLYTNYTDAIAGYRNYIGPLYVVNQTTFNDPSNMPSGTYNYQYSYYGAWTNLQGRGFMGFEQVQKYDSRSTLWENFFNDVKFPYVGILDAHYLSQDQARTKFIRTNWINRTYTLLDSTPNNQRYFPYINDSFDQSFEVGGMEDGVRTSTTETTYAMDNYGNATNVSTAVTDYDPNSPYVNDIWTTTTATSYMPANSSTWCLNLPTEQDVTSTPPTALGTPAITRHLTLTSSPADTAMCRVTQQVVETGTPYQLTSVLSYDSFGNVNGETDTGVGVPVGTPATRATAVNWGATGQFPTTETNALNQQTLTTFDPNTGLLQGTRDANNILTGWQYDDFGRMSIETRPDGTKTTWAYNPCGTTCINSNNKTTIVQTNLNKDGSILNIQNTYMDSIDRVLATSTQMINGAYDFNEVQYDNMGNVHKQGAPSTYALGTAYWATYAHDALNRVTSIQTPTSATVSTPLTTGYTYQGRTTTTTDPPTGGAPSGRVTTKITLPSGLLARTQDNSGYKINFSYDAFGSLLTAVDSASPSNRLFTASYAYGISAFQFASTDADLGAWTWAYDSFGELTSYIDAKGQNFSFLYDALSRPTQRTEPGQGGTNFVTNWNWGSSAASFNIGQLQSVSAASSPGTYSESYVYDGTGRLSTDTIVVPGDASYTYTITYSPTTGLPDTLQYPVVITGLNPLKIQYSYANGILQQISDSTVPGTYFWKANTINPEGQYLQESLGNGVIVNHAFDAVTGLVQSIQAGVGGGAALQNNSYQFDAVGNLIQRQDNNTPAVTENVFPDALYRLDHTVGDSSTQMTYDAIGRVATWEAYGATANVKDYTTAQPGCTYYPDHAQPHAVRKNTQGTHVATFCYDANGNVTNSTWDGAATAWTWTGFNQISEISGGSSLNQFFYDANHQRYKQLATNSGVVENTIYIGGLLEKMSNSSGTAYRHYIPAGNNTIVYTRLSTGTNSTYYISEDHLGSSAIISDSTGTSLVKEKFSALGWSENTAAEDTIIAGITRHQFTGHEGINGIDLINMNGRIYSASGAMFLSPDPYVPDPSDTQSFNRYSYASNNPLSRIDPSGFDDDPIDEYVVNGTKGLENLGKGVQDGLSAFFQWVGSLFHGGGENHSTAQQQKYSQAGLLNAQNLQGTPGAVPYYSDLGNGWFNVDAVSGTQGPQVAAITEYIVTSQSMGPGALTTPPPELTLMVEPPTAIHNFGVQIAQNLSEIAAGQAQSANYPSAIASTPSYWEIVRQSSARSGPKVATVLNVASFIPAIAGEVRLFRGVTAFISDATVVSRGQVIARGTVDLRATVKGIQSGKLAARNIFRNDQGLLPAKPPGYYREFVQPTPGINGVGPQRIVVGQGGELFYTPDHYLSFVPLNP
jgi:RHS repeat-associated protein